MNFSKTEIKNILDMLLSEDEENATIAFSCLHNKADKKNLGELLVLYQFGRISAEVWKKECKKGFKLLKNVLKLNNTDYRLPSSKVFNELVSNNCSKDSIELYLELFTNDFSRHLYGMGYPTDKLDIQIKIKE